MAVRESYEMPHEAYMQVMVVVVQLAIPGLFTQYFRLRDLIQFLTHLAGAKELIMNLFRHYVRS